MSGVTGSGNKLDWDSFLVNKTDKMPVVKTDNKVVKEEKIIPQASQKSTTNLPAQGKSATNVSFVEAPQKTGKVSSADTVANFRNTNSVSAEQIDSVLKKYNSPHAGKGKEFLEICKKNNINPVIMLAVMQQESIYGSTKLKEENQANPFSVHFTEGAKGIKKLRFKDGTLPTFAQSLQGACNTMNKLAGSSETPIETAGKKYSTTGSWSNDVKGHYKNLIKKLGI
ncbi:MAG: hypothetical protein AABZ74_04255 [Cyanobacteriota bacterium]